MAREVQTHFRSVYFWLLNCYKFFPNTGMNQFLFSVHLLCDDYKLTVSGEARTLWSLASTDYRVLCTQYFWSIIARQPCVVCHVCSDSCEYPSGKWFTLPPSSALESDHERERDREWNNHRYTNYRRSSFLTAMQRRSDLCISRNETGLIFNFHIHVSVSDLYILTIGPPILLQQSRRNRFASGSICFKFSVQCLGSVVLGLVTFHCWPSFL